MHLFISHSTKDGAAQAQALVSELERAGHRCWIAPRDVKAGVPYPGQIVAAIEGCAGFILIVTAGANDSPDVLQEAQLASAARKTIAPVMVNAAQPSPDLRYYIGVRHQLSWSDAHTIAAALDRTFKADTSLATGAAAFGARRVAQVRGLPMRLSFSPDGSKLCTVSNDQASTYLWDSASGRLLATFRGQPNSFQLDGKFVTTWGGRFLAEEHWLWNVASGHEVTQLRGKEKIEFSRDGTRLLSSRGSNGARLWDAASFREIASLNGNGALFVSDSLIVSYSDDRAWLCASDDGRIHAELGKFLRIDREGRRLFFEAGPGAISVHDTTSGRQVMSLRGSAVGNFKSGASCIATMSPPDTIHIAERANGRELFSVRGYAAFLSSDGTRILTRAANDTCLLWDARSGRQIAEMRGNLTFDVTADWSRFVTQSADRSIHVWNADGAEIASRPMTSKDAYCCGFSLGGSRVLVEIIDDADKPHTILFDAVSGQEVGVLKGHALRSEFNLSFVHTWDEEESTYWAWDLATGREFDWLRGSWFQISPDGSLVATTDSNFESRLWDASSIGREVAALDGAYPAFSPDGKRVLTITDNASVVWELAR